MRRTRQRGPSLVTIGLLALVVVVVGCYFGFTKAIPFRHHDEVRAVFKSSNNIRPGSPVRIAGVEVGKVVGIDDSASGKDTATLVMRINRNGLPLHKDATFKIRPRIFLEGNFFVDVSPGTPGSPPVDDDYLFPVNQTATPVQLDQVLAVLQSDTRDDLRTLLREYSSALSGAGARGYNRSIRYWKPAYKNTAIVSDAFLGSNEGDLAGYVRNAGATAAALDRNAGQLKSLITDFNTTANAFARVDGDLGSAIRELPRTLRVAQPALGSLNASFPNLRGLARDLRPGVRSSGPAIDASRPLVGQLRALVSEPELKGFVRDARPTVPALARLTSASLPLQRAGRELASCQNEVVLPWTRDKVGDPKFPASGRVFEEFGKVLPGLAGESRSGDANGQWFRVLLAGGTNLVQFTPTTFATTALPINGANPPKSSRPPLRADVPCETQQTPDLRSNPAAPPPQRKLDTSSAAYKARYAKAKGAAVDWLKGQLKREGLDKRFDVGDGDATEALLDQVAGRAGKTQVTQLEHVRGVLGRR